MNSVDVKIEWLGKKVLNLPGCTQYITVAKFSEDLNWQNEAWSIVLKFKISPSIQGNPSVGVARFLSPSAPMERLSSGNKFELYEGESLVAKVKVM